MSTEEKKLVKIPSTLTVKLFADILELPVSAVITELMKNKIMATINEEIDFETASIIAEDMGFIVEPDVTVAESETLTLERLLEICKKERETSDTLKKRPPIVTILGHVDHGKTTLLDTIRKASVASGEAGGITQHITAYQVKKRGELITFIDTPGHAAFSAMRERGVSIADIAILVVAADDGVRPQTEEVIKYLKEKNIPTVVAINKVDKPEANVARVKKELAEREIVLEEWGGKVVANEVSAKSNIGIGDLLESILLVAEVEEFKANPNRDGLGVVVESHMDQQKGPVATILVKTGTFKVGQDITAGGKYGRIRRMEDSAGKSIEVAGPSTPVTLYGLNEAPAVNDVVQVASQKTTARLKSQEFSEKMAGEKRVKSISDSADVPVLNIVLKADVQGSLEAIDQILSSYQSENVRFEYIKTGVGNITESDVKLAGSSSAIVYGFNTMPSSVAKRMAEDLEIRVKTYSIIYELVEDVKKELISLLPIEIIHTDLGELEVLGIFHTEKTKKIIGGKVTDGVAQKDIFADVYRGEEKLGKGTITNLQQNKTDTSEVEKGQECGLTIECEFKIKEGDTLKFYSEEEKKKEL